VTATRGDGGQGTVLRALAPALYDVEVRHVRHAALHRDFRHRVYLWLVDLDALPRLPFWLGRSPGSGRPTTSATRAARSAATSTGTSRAAGSTCAAAGC
jgi:hypothetical protein